MRRICSWCGKYLGDTPDNEPGTTHGICDKCAARVLAEEAARLAEEKRKKGAK